MLDQFPDNSQSCLNSLALGSSLVLQGEMQTSRGDQSHELSVKSIEVAGQSSAVSTVCYLLREVMRI
jgi:aspartyl/asparaginyl-tRNA synthetase